MSKTVTLSVALLVLAGSVFTACGNNGQTRNTATVKAAAVVPVDVSKSKQELDLVLGSLKGMRDAGEADDLKKLYGELKKSMVRLNDSLEDVASSADSAVSVGKAQFSAWHEKANAFTDADLRNASNKREGDLRVAVDELAASSAGFKTASASYQAQEAQVLSALDLDLSHPGVQTIKSMITRLLVDEPALRSSLAEVAEKSKAVSAVSNP
jgi:hypothetical protein